MSMTKASPGVYVTITAENHAEFVQKVDALHAGLHQPAPASKDDVRTAINSYVARTSMEKGRGLLQKVCGLEVLALSQIPEARYGDVLLACRTAT